MYKRQALYRRVKKSYLLALAVATGLSLAAFACFQLFPRQIISIFGTGSEMYYQFSERYFRIYMFLTLINGIQPVASNFFNSIGKEMCIRDRVYTRDLFGRD